jgi:hypothetical protein
LSIMGVILYFTSVVFSIMGVILYFTGLVLSIKVVIMPPLHEGRGGILFYPCPSVRPSIRPKYFSSHFSQ